MTTVGYATLDVIPSLKGFAGEIEKQAGGGLSSSGRRVGAAFGDHAGKSAGSRFGATFKRAAQASMVGLAALGAGAVKLGIDSVKAASDLEESTNKVAQVFGSGADRVFRFSEKAADALGQTNEQARTAAATFGIFGAAAGMADRKNARFATRMTTLASDLASFNNTDPSQAVEALGAALRGESEPIRAYGVMLDEATLKAEALRLGILKPVKDEAKIRSYQVRIMEGQKAYNEAVKEHGKESIEALKAEAALGTSRDQLRKATEGSIPPLTQQQKLLAAQSEIFKQTEVAQGDFARTSDGLANQQRRLAARFEDAKARLGTGLLPIMTDAADFLLDKGIPAFEKFADWFTKDGMPALKDFGGQVKTVAGFVGDLLGALNDLPKPAKYAGLAALLGGGAALKLRGGGGGALGTLGKAVGLSKPLPVFVTNPSFSGGGGAPGVVGAPGVAPDKPGKTGSWSKVGSALGKAAGPLMAGVIGISIVDAVMKNNSLLDPIGDHGARTGDALRKWIGGTNTESGSGILGSKGMKTLRESIRGTEEDVDRLRSKMGVFGDTLDVVGAKKVNPDVGFPTLPQARRNLERFYELEIQAGRPIEPNLKLLGYEPAMDKLYKLQKLKIGDKTLTIHTKYVDPGEPDFLSGGVRGARANGGHVLPRQPYLVGERGPEIFRPAGAGSIIANHELTTTGSGVTVNIGTVQAHDYGDFMRQTQRRAQRASLGGFGR